MVPNASMYSSGRMQFSRHSMRLTVMAHAPSWIKRACTESPPLQVEITVFSLGLVRLFRRVLLPGRLILGAEAGRTQLRVFHHGSTHIDAGQVRPLKPGIDEDGADADGILHVGTPKIAAAAIRPGQ